MAVLHDICQPSVRNQGYLNAVYDADSGICNRNGTGFTLSVEICGVAAWKSAGIEKEDTPGDSIKWDNALVRNNKIKK